ncbi:MAG: 2-amino-4-hydroxy-6-hydroxymethyldihydropteridine diphosphokinase [Clostridiales bacterium]|nr:2-amino-4-hydroxy-6-hydroxymethyldihydropteridine diphosphokinase [Clostridiales bacterium]
MDEIIIENLRVYAHHGVYKEENEKGQNFYINAVLYTDTAAAGKGDNLELTTDYGKVCRFLHKLVAENVYSLIETVAERTAEAVLLEFPLLHGITLEIRKPEAPIGLEFQSVSVKITRVWHMACVALGSNIGDKEKYIDEAIDALANDVKCRLVKKSDLVKSTAYGGVEQEDFLNGAVMIKTLYTPHELLARLHEIEQAAGRKRDIHWGPRTLDLDIIFYDDLVMDTEDLTIPHKDMQNRDFVLEPLAQIAPYVKHQALGKTVRQLYEEILTFGEKHVTAS